MSQAWLPPPPPRQWLWSPPVGLGWELGGCGFLKKFDRFSKGFDKFLGDFIDFLKDFTDSFRIRLTSFRISKRFFYVMNDFCLCICSPIKNQPR